MIVPVVGAGEVKKTMELAKRFEPKGKQRKPFGDGKAAQEIVEILVKGPC